MVSPFWLPPSQSWPRAGVSFSITSPQMLHAYLALPAYRQVAGVSLPSTST